MKILVIQLGSAADVLLSTPLLRCIKKQVNGAELHFLVRQELSELLVQNRNIDHLHLLNYNWKTTAEALKPVHFDHVINLHSDKEADAITEALPVPQFHKKQKGFKTFFQQLLHRLKKEHPAEQNIKRAALLGVNNDGVGLDYFIPHEAEVPYADIPAAHHAGYLVLAPHITEAQLWPLHLLQQLAASINHPIIITGNKSENSFADKVAAVDNIKIYNACGKFSAHENADLIRKAKLVVAAQSYYVQTAAAFQKELLWIQAEDSVAPYYGSAFLKKRTTPVFDTIKLPQKLLEPRNDAAANEEKDFINEITGAINKRLQRKA